MKHVAALALLLFVTSAAAQTISGGARFHPTGITAEATIEYGLDLLGVRFGPIASARGGIEEWRDAHLAVIAGVGTTITPTGVAWGIQVQLLYRVLFRTNEAPTYGPELVIGGTWHLGN